MVDVDQNALFELLAAADYLGIQPLLKLTSLAILLHYMWVGVYISNFGRNCDKLRLNSSFITWQIGQISRGYSKSIQILTVWWNHDWLLWKFKHWWCDEIIIGWCGSTQKPAGSGSQKFNNILHMFCSKGCGWNAPILHSVILWTSHLDGVNHWNSTLWKHKHV